jgi:hypothetical protein
MSETTSAGSRDYWHGGRRGLRRGDFLLSPYERRHELSSRERDYERVRRQVGYNETRDPRRVYFTIDRELARGWAVTRVAGGGSLYRVRPVPADDIAPDPDFVDPVGFSAPRAKVIEVAERTVYMSEDDAKRACCLKYVLWVDGSPAYDYDGFFQPPPDRRALGKTAADYRFLGPWVQFAELYGRLGYLTPDGRLAEIP